MIFIAGILIDFHRVGFLSREDSFFYEKYNIRKSDIALKNTKLLCFSTTSSLISMRSSQKWYRLVNGPKYGTGYSEKSSNSDFELPIFLVALSGRIPDGSMGFLERLGAKAADRCRSLKGWLRRGRCRATGRGR